MLIVNTSTNCAVGGVSIPVGQVEVPFHGMVGIMTSLQSTNATVGSGDTLFVWEGGYSVQPGYDIFLAISAGMIAACMVLGPAAVYRMVSKQLRGNGSAL